MVSISRLLSDIDHVTTGMASPIPTGGALLRRAVSGDQVRVSVLANQTMNAFTSGGSEIFNLAAQGRIGAFFLSGGQIDGAGNINLVGVGEYPQMQVRWSGSFGSGFLYYLVPKVILFRLEHTRRTMVKQIDFVSAPGTSPPHVHRPGGPHALITNLCLFMFDGEKSCFRLASVHAGHSVEEVLDNTGFDFDVPATVPQTPVPTKQELALLRDTVAPALSRAYPRFCEAVFSGVAGTSQVHRPGAVS